MQVPWSPKDAKSAGWIVASSAIWYHVLCENSDDFIIMNEVLLVSQFEGGKGEAFVLSIQEMKFTIHHLGQKGNSIQAFAASFDQLDFKTL